MDGASESLTLRHILETRTMLRVFLCLLFAFCDEIKTDLILSYACSYGSSHKKSIVVVIPSCNPDTTE